MNFPHMNLLLDRFLKAFLQRAALLVLKCAQLSF